MTRMSRSRGLVAKESELKYLASASSVMFLPKEEASWEIGVATMERKSDVAKPANH